MKIRISRLGWTKVRIKVRKILPSKEVLLDTKKSSLPKDWRSRILK